MKNILFIVKSSSDNNVQAKTNYMPPLGLLSIANMLRLHGYNVEVLDFSAQNYQTEEISSIIETLQPIYIGFSVYTENVDNVFKMCRYIKKNFPHIPLVLGGPHPTLDTEYCKKKRFVDFILMGDGEHSALELAEAIRTNQKLISFSEIQGIVYKNENDEYCYGKDRKFVTNMDLLPIINRDYLPICFTATLPTIYSSRGCPGRCIYCAAPAMSGRKYRVRDIENVFLESLYIVDVCKNYFQIFYCDDTFTVFRNRLEHFIKLCDQIENKFLWRCESRVDALYKYSDLLEGLKRAGCRRIQFGIESGNQEVLNNIRKGLILEQAYEIIDKTVNCGIPVVTSFMFGHYCDTEETMTDTLNMMEFLTSKYNGQVEVAYALNTPFPGTYQFEHMEELGLELVVKNFAELDMYSSIVRTKNFDERTLRHFNERAMKVYNIGR
jgi:anaerobic magnesium-protoporphyrin IX monomethyl ester cyclase